MIDKHVVSEIMRKVYLKAKGTGPSDLFVFNKLELMGVLTGPDVIDAAEHDQIYLAVDEDKFLEIATPEEVEELGRSGLLYDPVEGFYMYV